MALVALRAGLFHMVMALIAEFSYLHLPCVATAPTNPACSRRAGALPGGHGFLRAFKISRDTTILCTSSGPS
jgi:hypothetical protein